MDMNDIRQAIDAVDDMLLSKLMERHELAQQLGLEKRRLNIPIFDPARELEIMERLSGNNNGRLDDRAVHAIWREVFSASRQAQLPLRVAYLGPEGTFTHQAALARFGSSAELLASQTISAAFNLVLNSVVDYAVLPVENTMHGIVGETLDLLGAAKQPFIIGELTIPIHFVFSSRAEKLESIKKIYSKNEAFLQCSTFLMQPALSNASRVPVSSTSEAARTAVNDPEGAALSSEIAASQAGVPILFHHVENNSANKTRFLVLGAARPTPTGRDKTSVFAKVPNVSGGLEGLLRSFREHNINLTKIESRPMDAAANFETWFYIDMQGHAFDAGIKAVIDKHELVWLGSYPVSE